MRGSRIGDEIPSLKGDISVAHLRRIRAALQHFWLGFRPCGPMSVLSPCTAPLNPGSTATSFVGCVARVPMPGVVAWCEVVDYFWHDALRKNLNYHHRASAGACFVLRRAPSSWLKDVLVSDTSIESSTLPFLFQVCWSRACHPGRCYIVLGSRACWVAIVGLRLARSQN